MKSNLPNLFYLVFYLNSHESYEIIDEAHCFPYFLTAYSPIFSCVMPLLYDSLAKKTSEKDERWKEEERMYSIIYGPSGGPSKHIRDIHNNMHACSTVQDQLVQGVYWKYKITKCIENTIQVLRNAIKNEKS